MRPYLDLHDDQVIELVTPDSSPHMLAISWVSTRMVADGSYRASRLTGTTSRPAVAVRDAGIWLVGHLAPGLMIRQLAPIVS